MLQVKYLDKTLFEQTNHAYTKEISPQCNFGAYRGKKYGRIVYQLPNGTRSFFYSIPKECESNSKLREKVLFEFEMIIRNYYFPLSDVEKLTVQKTTSTSRKKSIDDVIELYFTKFNFGKYKKKDKVIRNEKSTLIYLLGYFKNKKRRLFIEDITSNDLRDFNNELLFWCESNKRPINENTGKSYKKVVKTFLNCCAHHFDLNYNTNKIDGSLETPSNSDEEAYTRTTYIPPELLDAVDRLVYVEKENYVNTQELIYFLKRTGLCKEELSTLSEENLYPSVKDFDRLKIKNKPDCPSVNQMGLELKTKRREREIFLDERSKAFIKSQIEKHKNHIIYGKILFDDGKIEYVPYRFLFPIKNTSRWLRCDNFLRGIQALFQRANEEFKLSLSGRYQLHDFRRSINIEMGDAGIPVEDRAYILGHHEDVNEKHYMGYKKRQEAKAKKARPIFKKFLKDMEVTSASSTACLG